MPDVPLSGSSRQEHVQTNADSPGLFVALMLA